MIFGLDHLGLAKYADLAAREHPQGWALGCFANTFGDSLPAVERIIASGRCPFVRVQLVWSDTHTFAAREVAQAYKEAARWEKLARKYPAVKFELSPFCEHNLRNPDSYLDKIKEIAPSCTPVNTPWKGAYSKKYKNEVHGSNARALSTPYNFSYDGSGCVDADVQAHKAKHKGADVFFFWTYQFNGRRNANDPTPRPQRKFWPTSGLIDSVIYLHRDKGDQKLESKYLWKSHSDQHENPPEPRALKPVLIAPVKAPRAELVASNGQVVAVLPYYGPFSDGRHRYYLGEWGYQVAEKARRIQGGSGVVTLRIAGESYGTLNPAFRANEFRA